ncbi:MAG: alpha-N-arabinofuranosidase, partial [Saprospiraceae bacterium]
MKYRFKLVCAYFVLAFPFNLEGQAVIKVSVDGSLPTHQISRHIYGHFSEHLGRCIYDGFWVSDSMNVPK